MNFEEIKDFCKKGYTAIIPNWTGYLDWNYSIDNIYFHNGNYTLNENELEQMLKTRNDLYYII